MKIKTQKWLRETVGLVSSLLFLGAVATAQADEIIQIRGTSGARNPITGPQFVGGGLPSFSFFDPALGTLNSVTIKVHGEMSASIWVGNPTGDPFGVTGTPEVSITVLARGSALIVSPFTDSLRNGWTAGDHLEPGQGTWLTGGNFGVDDRENTFIDTDIGAYIDPGLLDEDDNPITDFFMTLVIQAGAQGTFIPSASSLPIVYWYNEGNSREIWISEKITITLIYDYTPN